MFRNFSTLLFAVLIFPWQAQADVTPSSEILAKLEDTLKAARADITLDEGRLRGPGAEHLKARATAARFTLIGEDHGVQTIAELSSALLKDLRPVGYDIVAIEVDPYTARTLESLIRSPDRDALKAFLAKPGRPIPVPFFNWKAEADFVRTAISGNPREPVLWGLDQVFIGAAFDQLTDIASRAKSQTGRAKAEKLATAARDNLEFLGKVSDADLQDLRATLDDPADALLAAQVDDMLTSAQIYRPFTGGSGSVYAANLARETLMKRTFLRNYRKRQTETGPDVRVLFKFGANHMQRGLSLTNVPALGSFVSELALHDGVQSFHVAILPGPGAMQAVAFQSPKKADADFEKNFAAFKPHLSSTGSTLFDMTPFHDRPGRWAHFPEEARKLIWSFDAIVFVPNGKPSEQIK